MKYKDNINKTREMKKEIIWKTEMINNNLPGKIIVNGGNILEKKQIAKKLNKFFYKSWFKADKENTTTKIFFCKFISQEELI